MATAGCAMGNGVKHVVEVFFDNVHYTRDNPDVPSDLEQLPVLKNFIEDFGTLNSNEHTPLIAHTADNSLTNYTGLYGDRQGMGLSNDYETYNPGNTSVDTASSFAYWTGAVNDTTNPPTPGHDTDPSMIYSAGSPSQAIPNTSGQNGLMETPAPWVPYTRSGCDVGDVSAANMELENTNPDLANVFGPNSPEVAQLNGDTNSFKDQETNDYVGLSVHCAKGEGAALCNNAEAVKFGQSNPSPTAVPDVLPTEPGGYDGFTALHGHKYIQPVVGPADVNNGSATTRTLTRAPGIDFLPSPAGGQDTFPVLDSSGNLTDLFGNEIDGEFSDASGPGFPGFGPITAAQSLGYTADLQEAGVPVTSTYISDLHERKFYPSNYLTAGGVPSQPPACTTTGARTGFGLGPGDPCYEYNAQQWNAAFAVFFQRLADDGITPANTLFVFAADEGDHFNGANVGRAIQPSCTGTPGVALDTATNGQSPYQCSYGAGSVGEVDTNIHGLLAAQQGDSTSSFFSQPQGEAVYVTSTATDTRRLEQEFAAATIDNPYTGNPNTPVTNFMADKEEESILHISTADPNRTATFIDFPESDIFFSQGTSDRCTSPVDASTANTQCRFLNTEFLWNHGYYAPEIDTTWAGLVGPGVARRGLDGFAPADGPNSAGPTSGLAQTVPANLPGTWIDQADIRPTMMYLVGLKDDYVEDGRVITQDLAPRSLTPTLRNPLITRLGVCYKQLDGSVGEFGTATLRADTAAVESASPGDTTYQQFENRLAGLATARDTLATQVKSDLWRAEFRGALDPAAAIQLRACNQTIQAANALTAS
ncbi:MAG: hypothetical protein J2P58_08020 [Acidimicrobiaceae bacterium]|nr:hypothetical protein [Acidimicrobiaceae bacterium]